MPNLPLLTKACVCVLIALPLGGCPRSDGASQAAAALPPVPADLQSCFRDVAELPDRELSAGEIEELWKLDRYRAVLEQRCGVRFLAWYESLRKGWR